MKLLMACCFAGLVWFGSVYIRMDKLWEGGKQDPIMVEDALSWIDWDVVIWYVGSGVMHRS